MRQKKILFGLLLAFALLLGGAYALYTRLGQSMAPGRLAGAEPAASESASGSASQRTPAPDFTVYDGEGNEVHLSDYAGKPVVLNFWSSRCGPCQTEMPDFHEKYLELGQDVHFLMVNVTDGSWDTEESASSFLKEEGYTFPALFDTDSSATGAYGVYALPATYFIDGEGYAVAWAGGMIGSDTLQQGIDMILE